MIPDPEVMEKLAGAIEEKAAERGWDAAPMLAIICRLRAPSGVPADLFEVIPFPIQPHHISGDPAQGLLYIAGIMLTESPPPVIPASRIPDFAGVAFQAEGWMRTGDMPDQGGLSEARAAVRRERRRDGRRFADIPGSLETRFVHLIDCGGRHYMVNRVRGKKPTALVAEPGNAETALVGNIPVGLRDFLLAIGAQLPFGSMDLDAVRGIGAEDMSDLLSEGP